LANKIKSIDGNKLNCYFKFPNQFHVIKYSHIDYDVKRYATTSEIKEKLEEEFDELKK